METEPETKKTNSCTYTLWGGLAEVIGSTAERDAELTDHPQWPRLAGELHQLERCRTIPELRTSLREWRDRVGTMKFIEELNYLNSPLLDGMHRIMDLRPPVTDCSAIARAVAIQNGPLLDYLLPMASVQSPLRLESFCELSRSLSVPGLSPDIACKLYQFFMPYHVCHRCGMLRALAAANNIPAVKAIVDRFQLDCRRDGLAIAVFMGALRQRGNLELLQWALPLVPDPERALRGTCRDVVHSGDIAMVRFVWSVPYLVDRDFDVFDECRGRILDGGDDPFYFPKLWRVVGSRGLGGVLPRNQSDAIRARSVDLEMTLSNLIDRDDVAGVRALLGWYGVWRQVETYLHQSDAIQKALITALKRVKLPSESVNYLLLRDPMLAEDSTILTRAAIRGDTETFGNVIRARESVGITDHVVSDDDRVALMYGGD